MSEDVNIDDVLVIRNVDSGKEYRVVVSDFPGDNTVVFVEGEGFPEDTIAGIEEQESEEYVENEPSLRVGRHLTYQTMDKENKLTGPRYLILAIEKK